MPMFSFLRTLRAKQGPSIRYTREDATKAFYGLQEAQAEAERRAQVAQRVREEAREARGHVFELRQAVDAAELRAERMESRSRVADDMARQAASLVVAAQDRLEEVERDWGEV